MDGKETTMYIRKVYGPKHFIVCTTADMIIQNKGEYQKIGMDYFLSKPITTLSLMDAIKECKKNG